jgi:hypothetical protein
VVVDCCFFDSALALGCWLVVLIVTGSIEGLVCVVGGFVCYFSILEVARDTSYSIFLGTLQKRLFLLPVCRLLCNWLHFDFCKQFDFKLKKTTLSNGTSPAMLK